MSSKKKGAKTAEEGEAAAAAPAPSVPKAKKGAKTAAAAAAAAEPANAASAAASAAAEAASAAGQAASAAGQAASAAGQAAAAAAAAAPGAPAPLLLPAGAAAAQAAAQAPPYVFQIPVPAPVIYEFTDASTNAEIITALEDISIEDSEKIESLKHLSAPKLCSILSDAAVAERAKIMLLDSLDYSGFLKILTTPDAIPEAMLAEVHRRMKSILQRSSWRRRGSTTNLAVRTRELFAKPALGARDTCFFKPVHIETIEAMFRVFPVLQFAGLSQYTYIQIAPTEEISRDLDATGPVAIITIIQFLTGNGRHANAYIRAGTSWYDADNSHAVLKERLHGQPTWKTTPRGSNTKVVLMFYCYADTSKISQVLAQRSQVLAQPAPGALHGHPTFAQDGMGSCSIDALASVLCFADGFRDIMVAAMNAGIDPIVVAHMGHTRERVQDVPRCLADVEAFISSRLIATLSGPIFSQQRPPAAENFLPVSTAPQGSMFFSKQYGVPSGELLSRFIRYLAGTAIRFHGIRLEAGLGHVAAKKNHSFGLGYRKPRALKSLALSRRLKNIMRVRRASPQPTVRPGMAVKATRKTNRSPVNQMAALTRNRNRNRNRTRRNRQEKRIIAKRRGH